MSDDKGKFTKNLKYIYGEDLTRDGQPIRVTLTIAGFKEDDEFIDARGVKTKADSVIFKETPKMFGLCGSTVTRQLHMAVGSDSKAAAIGKRVTLYAVTSKKSATGWAVRIGPAAE